MDAAERTLLEESVASALAGADDADAALTKLGWLDLLGDAPADAIAIVFDVLGRTGATASALDDVVVAALGVPPRADLAMVLPRFGTWDAPGGDGLATARAPHAAHFLVAGAAGVTSVPADRARVEAIGGVDPGGGWHRVRIAEVASGGAGTVWDDGVARGRRAVAQQIGGACRAMLDLAVAHARERIQFGRPIASFQAVRHRLADAFVAVEGLDATLQAAADEPGPTTAALAKATAGRAARTVATHCQQVLAGIGFTTEHPFHQYLKRTLVLEGLFGATDDITTDLGAQLLAARRVPTLIEL